ncbi:MAG: hypothetical protein ACREKL_03565, partial [Chthoniobacterales bacterium]
MPRAVTIFAAFLAIAVPALHAGDILRGGAPMPGVHARTSVGSANPGGEAATRTQSNAKDRLARTTAAMDAVKAMQRAARAAAGAGRIKNPNGNGKLPRVPDGLGNGGLQVAAGVPKNLN